MLFHQYRIYHRFNPDTLTNDTMADNQNQNPIRDPRNLDENGMNEYARITDEWNQSNQVRDHRRQRNAEINNTDGYRTGNRIHHIRSIQMPIYERWNELFGHEILNPSLREYSQACLDWVQDETRTLLFAGQMEVSLLMQENYRPGVHVAVFIIHLTPHRHFCDGHMIQMEFGEGSHTHQTISRMFDVVDGHVIIQQATEYQMLGFLADDDEAMNLLHSCFLDPDFAPMRFSFVEPDPNDYDDYGYYMMDQHAIDNHRWHEFADDPAAIIAAPAPAVIAIPPPPPANDDFAEIYRRNLAMMNDVDEFIDNLERRDDDEPRRNIIQYFYDGSSDDDELPERG